MFKVSWFFCLSDPLWEITLQKINLESYYLAKIWILLVKTGPNFGTVCLKSADFFVYLIHFGKSLWLSSASVFFVLTLDSLISVGLCLLISRIFSRVYDLIREVFSIAIGNKFEIFNLSSKLSVIQHYFCFFCKISRVYAYFSGQIFQRLCLFKGRCLLESLE